MKELVKIVTTNEGTTGANKEQLEKQAIQSFMRAAYHTCVFNMACVGTCKCNRTPFPSRPDKN